VYGPKEEKWRNEGRAREERREKGREEGERRGREEGEEGERRERRARGGREEGERRARRARGGRGGREEGERRERGRYSPNCWLLTNAGLGPGTTWRLSTSEGVPRPAGSSPAPRWLPVCCKSQRANGHAERFVVGDIFPRAFTSTCNSKSTCRISRFSLPGHHPFANQIQSNCFPLFIQADANGRVKISAHTSSAFRVRVDCNGVVRVKPAFDLIKRAD
jgi:hypothetical protein